MQEIYQTIKQDECSFRIKLMKKNLGLCERRSQGRSKITINIFDCLAPTVIHECLHHLYPEKSEKQIERLEKRYIKKSSSRQRIYLVKLFFWRIYEKKR